MPDKKKEPKETSSSAKASEDKKGSKDMKVVKKSELSVPVYSIAGVASGEMELPKGIFGEKVNKSLLAQAMRVYLTNRAAHFSHTKTRSEVVGTTKKMYKQKGTGRARHGAATAPIFVGGGIALGPKFRKTVLDLPKKMRAKALISALSDKALQSEILGVSNLEKASGKTKEMAKFLEKIAKKSVLVVAEEKREKAFRALKNLKGVSFLPAVQVNAYEVIKHQSLVLTKDALERLEKRLLKKNEEIEGNRETEKKRKRGGKRGG